MLSVQMGVTFHFKALGYRPTTQELQRWLPLQSLKPTRRYPRPGRSLRTRKAGLIVWRREAKEHAREHGGEAKQTRREARFHATLTGVTAWEPRPPLAYGGVIVDSTLTEAMLQQMSDRLDAAGKHFRAVVGGQQPTGWRTAFQSPTEFLASQARAADLLVIGRDRVTGDLYRSLDPGATMLQAGRPVLVAPAGIESLELRNVVIAWKDTREARRALQDALPLLGEAKRLSIVGICETDVEDQTRKQIDDVAGYLARHRIDVATRMTVHAAGRASKELLRVAQDEKADLIVAGSYGRSRLGEWIFGGTAI
jgi:nucleotide-binding universal stress UspA family protein